MRWRGRTLRSVSVALILLVVVLAVLWSLQRRMMYFPSRAEPVPAGGVRAVALTTSDGLRLTAWLVPADATPAQPVAVLVTPGNAGNRGDRMPLATALAATGLTVLLLDYRGYGANPGSPSEEGLTRDARAGWDHLTTNGFAAGRTLAPMTEESTVDIMLVAGLWLDGSVWDDVVPALEKLGHRPVPLTLPGQGAGPSTATLDDQVAAVVAAVDSSPGKPMVVGHSAASTLAWLAADARPEKVAKVAFIGGFPSADGQPYADLFETTDGAMPFPGWAPFEGPDSADLDEEARRRIASAAIPVPEGVSRGVVRLTDERRFDVPVVLVCPEFSPAEAQEWIRAGEVPELARARHVDFVDIDSGHWPMVTSPVELARLLADAAGG